jgi:hypothetical protein
LKLWSTATVAEAAWAFVELQSSVRINLGWRSAGRDMTERQAEVGSVDGLSGNELVGVRGAHGSRGCAAGSGARIGKEGLATAQREQGNEPRILGRNETVAFGEFTPTQFWNEC